MKQEDMFEKIKTSAEDVPIPEGLLPENMMKKLPDKKHNIPRIYRYGGMVAAALAIVIVAWGAGNLGKRTAMGEDQIRFAEKYSDVYSVLAEEQDTWSFISRKTMSPTMAGAEAVAETSVGVMEDGMAPEMAMGAESNSTEMAKEFSATNTQVQGIDEGDVVKTDGSYLYVMDADKSRISLLMADGETMEKTSVIDINRSLIEFYLYQDKLMLVSQIYGDDQPRTYIDTYDISDKKAPIHIGSISQDGYYKDSRSSQGYVYLFTSYAADVTARKKETDKYIPNINQKPLPAEDICIPNDEKNYQMLVISSVDWESPKDVTDHKAVLTSAEEFYVSSSHIYTGSTMYDWNSNQFDYTELLKFSYDKGEIAFKAKTNVNGTLNNQFSLDEYKGSLRIVSTLGHNGGNDTNALYIYDEELKLTGKVEDLAPGERIYSARFMGDIVYFVTFRNMDPLFSVDVSDPTSPKVLGELKITGFSEYLHPYKEGLMLGLGREIDPVTGNYKGLKLSMFNISSPRNVTEEQKLVEQDVEYSPAWGNHKAVLADDSRNVLGFTVQEVDKTTREVKYKYVVYSYDRERGFEKKLDFQLADSDMDNIRGVYIKNYMYVIESGRVTSFTLEDFTQRSQLKY